MIIRKLDWVPGDSVARAKPPAELAFRVLKTMEPVVIDGTSETILVEDRVVDVTIGAASTQRYILNVVPGMDIPNGITVDYVSDDPNIAECDGNIVNRVSNGTTTVTVTVTSGTLGSTSQKVGVTFTTSGGAIQYNDVTGVPDTPRAEATEVIRDYLIEGKSKNLFNGSAWNDNRWCAHIDLTCVPMTPSRFYGALVTPRHILGCAHAQLGVGVAVSFKIGSSTVNRTIIGKLVHPAYSVPTTYTNDFCLYLLDDDVTGALPAKVLPDDWEALFPTGLEYIPLIGCDQEKLRYNGDYLWVVGQQPHANPHGNLTVYFMSPRYQETAVVLVS